MTLSDNARQRSLATVALSGGIGFVYQLSEMLKHHACWCDFGTPPGVGEVLFALACGLAAMGAALGLDVGSFVRSFRKE